MMMMMGIVMGTVTAAVPAGKVVICSHIVKTLT